MEKLPPKSPAVDAGEEQLSVSEAHVLDEVRSLPELSALSIDSTTRDINCIYPIKLINGLSNPNSTYLLRYPELITSEGSTSVKPVPPLPSEVTLISLKAL